MEISLWCENWGNLKGYNSVHLEVGCWTVISPSAPCVSINFIYFFFDHIRKNLAQRGSESKGSEWLEELRWDKGKVRWVKTREGEIKNKGEKELWKTKSELPWVKKFKCNMIFFMIKEMSEVSHNSLLLCIWLRLILSLSTLCETEKSYACLLLSFCIYWNQMSSEGLTFTFCFCLSLIDSRGCQSRWPSRPEFVLCPWFG